MSRNVGRILAQVLRQIIEHLVRGDRRSAPPRTGTRSTSTQDRRKVVFPFDTSRPNADLRDPATVEAPMEHAAREYRMPPTGLPRLEYAPRRDGEADPGEVVWAWVPYEDDPNKGKDRPVLIISEVTGGYLGLQMTSKDHSRDRSREAHFGRHWLDIGSGAWDSKRRDSEVRLDRLLFLPPNGIRREGATLPKDRFAQVARALEELHG